MEPRITGPKIPEGYEVWWRADDKRYANYDPFEEIEQDSGSHVVIELTPFIVHRHTPKGVVVSRFMGQQTFVLGNAIRQLCVPTKELALHDLVCRKMKHHRMALLRADDAAKALLLAQKARNRESLKP